MAMSRYGSIELPVRLAYSVALIFSVAFAPIRAAEASPDHVRGRDARREFWASKTAKHITQDSAAPSTSTAARVTALPIKSMEVGQASQVVAWLAYDHPISRSKETLFRSLNFSLVPTSCPFRC